MLILSKTKPSLREWPEQPYKGLSYYEADDAPLFAGRNSDIVRCAQLFVRSTTRILILHGQTGCGKSSFLRAGLIPFLENEEIGFGFLKDKQGEKLKPIFIRSTGKPLVELAEKVFDFAKTDIPIETPTGETYVLGLPLTLGDLDELRFIEKANNDPEFLIDTLGNIAKKLPKSLVLIIDQGEEVFTLQPEKEDNKHARNFFRFIDLFSKTRFDLKLLVALRTEYYGRFCGNMQQAQIFSPNVIQFLLDDLSKKQIVAAIEQPTSQTEIKGYGIPFERYNFEYEDNLSELIADELLSKKLAGGILPVLQVVCGELYQKTKPKDGEAKHWKISEDSYRDLGSIEDLVEKSIDQSFASFCKENAVTSDTDIQRETDSWKNVLSELACSQSDGTVTTLVKTEKELKQLVKKAKCKLDFDKTMKYLADPKVRILRDTVFAAKDVNQKKVVRYSLGHDTIALVLLHWKQRKTQEKLHSKIIQSLPPQALFQLKQGQYELAALLVREAYRFIQKDKNQDNLELMGQVHEILSEVLSKHFGCVIQNDMGQAECVAFNSNGSQLAVGSKQGKVLLWNLDRQNSKPEILSDDKIREVESLAFSPNDSFLAVGFRDNHPVWEDRIYIKVFDLRQASRTFKVLKNDVGPWLSVGGVVFHPKQSNILFSCGDDGRMILWNLDEADEKAEVIEDRFTDNSNTFFRDNWIRAIAFNQAGDLLASAGKHGLVNLWSTDGTTHKPEHKGYFYHWLNQDNQDNHVNSLAFHPIKQRILVTAGWSKEVRIWDLDQPTSPVLIKTLSQHKGFVSSVTFSPDGKILAIAGEDQNIRLWDIDWNITQPDQPLIATLIETLEGHYFGINSIAFSPKDNRLLASGGWDETVRLWNISKPITKVLYAHESKVSTVTFISDEELVSGSWDKTVRLWDINGTDKSSKILYKYKHKDKVFSVAYYCSHDKQIQQLASAGQDEDSTVIVGDLCQPDAAPCILEHKNNPRGVGCVAISPDGQLLASGSKDNGVRLWSLKRVDNRNIPDFGVHLNHKQSVNSVAFSPDGKLLASADCDKTICLWNLEDPINWFLIHRWEAHSKRILSVAFSPKGELLASASDDRTIRLWNIAKPTRPELIATLVGHNYWVSSVAFNQNGTRLASGSYDKTIRIWDISKPEITPSPIILSGHSETISSIAFSPNSKLLASASFDDTIRLWQIDTETLANKVSKNLRTLSQDEWQNFIGPEIKYPY